MTSSDPSQIRVLGPGDVPALRGMLSMFGAAFEDIPRYQDALPSDAYLTRLLARPHFIALAAFCGEAVVGGIAAYELEKFERECSEIYIYDLAVAETHRRRGIATAMIRRLVALAADRGAYVVFVQADLEDAPAIALYAKLGRQETAHHFDFDVPPATRRP